MAIQPKHRKGAGIINSDEYLEYLIESYQNLIFSICFKFTNDYFEAEDLAQDTFISAYKNLNDFDKANEKAWLSKIATNKCLDYIKSPKKRTIPTNEEFFLAIEQSASSPETITMENESKAQLYFLCQQLKKPYKEVSLDYFYYELDVTQISTKTGKPPKTIQTQIYRAKGMLKKLYRKEGIF